MTISLSFLGAARTVTGSCFLLETGRKKILVECGLFQERALKARNWEPFPVPPSQIDCVLLTHGHLDHCGLLPKLVRDGFKGRIYCTEPTADVAKIVLMDSARIQEEDAEFKKKRHAKEGRVPPRPVVPLYTVADVEAAAGLFTGVKYDAPFNIDGIEIVFTEAGHILGSSVITVSAGPARSRRRIVFSGDIGRTHTPILRDPEPMEEADYVLVESTYGNRIHRDNSTISFELSRHISETAAAGGKILIPSFAVERAQELLFRLYELRRDGMIPDIPVYLDSPMAVRITEVLRKHPEIFDDETSDMLARGEHPFDFKGLHLCSSVEESKSLNEIKKPVIIIAGSGMCTGGRIKHHLVNNIGDPKSMVLFIGYQAAGTLGRRILEKEQKVRILGMEREVRSRVAKVNGFSAHAGQDELLKWLLTLKRSPRRIFVVHGEFESSDAFARHIRENTGGWDVVVPGLGEKFELN